MNDSEIIKALECCSKDDCDNCPNIFGNCNAYLAKETLELITRLQTEIERLNATVEKLEVATETAIESTELSVDFFSKKAVREFAEKLKENSHQYLEFDKSGFCDITSSVKVEVIDQLFKEMIGAKRQ